MRKPFWLLALALIASVNSLQADGQSPVKTVWSRRLKLEGYDSSEFTLLDKNGNVFAFASLAQWPYLVRYGSDGHLNWDRRLIYYPRGNPIAVSQNGNCFSIQAARTSNTLSLVCLSPEGDLVWSQPASTGPTALAIDPNGDLLVAGSVTAKYSGGTGHLIWQHRDPTGQQFSNIRIDGMGDLYLTGTASSPSLVKCSGQTGEELWKKSIPLAAPGYYIIHSAVDRRGNVVTLSVTFQEFGFLSFLSYYDSNGKKQWQKSPDQFPGLSQEVAIDQDGNVFVAGGNSLVVKYLGSNGEISWQHQDSFPSFFGGIALDRSGNPVVSSGLPIRPPKHRYDFPKYAFETIKFDGNSGSVLWQKRELNAVFAQPSSVAVEAGVVAVTGNAGGDAITIKYADGPTPHTLSAEILGESSARLTGEVTPNLFSTDAAFLFGTDPALEGASITEYTTIGSGRDAVRVGATIGLLQPGQTYYFCVVGQPKDGLTIKGDIRKFSTPAFR